MTEEKTGSFRTFLENVGIKGSSKKVKFMPNVTKPSAGKDKEESASSSKSQKEHRRAQVRKAQIEHRQRKENYVKHLEQDVIRLREMISAVEIETTAFRQENSAIKTTLLRSNITPSINPVTTSGDPQKEIPPTNFQSPLQDSAESSPNAFGNHPRDLQWSSNSSNNTVVSVNFDDMIDTGCLHISPASDFDSATILNSPDIFTFPLNTLPTTSPAPALNFSRPNPQPPQVIHSHDPTAMPNQPDTSSIGINFILALEHPCRTHFHAPASEFNPKGDPSGHELMASTLLYSHAPPQIFQNLDSATWSIPSLELTQLWEMSQSLQKGDWEITPVQAWFLLTGTYEVGRLMGEGGKRLEELKAGLAGLVSCFSFGAVMDVGAFWEVVGGIMGDGGL